MPGTVSESGAIAWGPPGEKSGTPPIRSEKTAEIALQRIATLAALVRTIDANCRIGNAKWSDLYDVQDTLLNAQLEAAKSKAERVAICESLLESRQKLEKLTESMFEVGVNDRTDLLRRRRGAKRPSSVWPRKRHAAPNRLRRSQRPGPKDEPI